MISPIITNIHYVSFYVNVLLILYNIYTFCAKYFIKFNLNNIWVLASGKSVEKVSGSDRGESTRIMR